MGLVGQSGEVKVLRQDLSSKAQVYDTMRTIIHAVWRKQYALAIFFFIKLMTFTTLISTIPLLFLGIYSFFQSTSTVQTKVNEANVFILQQSQSRVEQILKVIEQVSGRFAETPLVVNSVSRRMEIEDFQDVDLLVKGLLSVQTYELGVKDIELHSLQNGWYIKDSGFYFGTDTAKIPVSLNAANNSRWMPEQSPTFAGLKLVKAIPATAAEPKGYLSVRVSNTELASCSRRAFQLGKR